MTEFLEERLSEDTLMGSRYSDAYAVKVTEDESENEYRKLLHKYPKRRFYVSFAELSDDLWENLLGLYHRAFGMYAGFRVKAWDDYTTNNRTETPTAFDQELAVVTAGSIYQLQVEYGAGGTPLSIGLPVRTIFKPVAGTIKVAIGTEEQAAAAYSVDTTTGKVTFAANKTFAVSDISNAAQAVLTLGAHTLVVGDTVHISGVVGMTEINGLRGTVMSKDATTITVNIDSALFTAYSSGGTVNTRPQTGETVYGGCEFDIPCRFNGDIDVSGTTVELRETGSIEILELLNP